MLIKKLVFSASQVGFFPDDAPENFEGRRFLKKIAEITNGTYQVDAAGTFIDVLCYIKRLFIKEEE